MIASLSLILLCQLAGEAFVRGLELPVPLAVTFLLR
jgi:holin-like protein